jgi:hypothetical protein
MRIILSIIALLLMTPTFSQSEKMIDVTTADRFQSYYNNQDYNAVFDMFSPEMKNAVPLDKIQDFLKRIQLQSGKIIKKEFTRYQQSYAIYKTSFERGIFALHLAVGNNGMISGLFIRPFADDNLPKMERNTTKMRLPFNGEWTVFWGGDTKELNYHVENQAQKNAFDILVMNEAGKSFKTNGSSNEDYYAFGKELLAPCDGEVVLSVDGVKDNKPGEMNPIYVPGNSVIIKTANNEFLLFAHFKQNSILVKQGQMVKQGQLLGLCGNSGNSSEPHLHFHIQNTENMNVATGVKCYFDKLIVNGQPRTDYSPVKKDKIKNEE